MYTFARFALQLKGCFTCCAKQIMIGTSTSMYVRCPSFIVDTTCATKIVETLNQDGWWLACFQSDWWAISKMERREQQQSVPIASLRVGNSTRCASDQDASQADPNGEPQLTSLCMTNSTCDVHWHLTETNVAVPCCKCQKPLDASIWGFKPSKAGPSAFQSTPNDL